MNMEISPNNIEKEKVLEMLKTNGFEHPETKELVIKWLEQREAEAEKENTVSANFNLSIDRIDLYVATGNINEAFICLKEIRGLLDMDRGLSQEELNELYKKLFNKMDELRYPKDKKEE